MNISELPEYGPAMQAYQAAKREADASGDPVKIAEVEHGWRSTTLDLREKALEGEQRSGAVTAAREKAKRDYPHAPDAVLAALSDPAAIEQAAKQSHEAIAAAMPKTGTPPASGAPAGSWGSPAPAAASGAATGGEPRKTLDEFKSELAPSVLRGLPGSADNERLRKGIFGAQIASRFDWAQPSSTPTPQQ